MNRQPSRPRLGPPMEITIRITFAYDGDHATSDQIRTRLSRNIFTVLGSWKRIGVNGFVATKKMPLVPGQVIHAQAEIRHGCVYGERHHDLIEL